MLHVLLNVESALLCTINAENRCMCAWQIDPPRVGDEIIKETPFSCAHAVLTCNGTVQHTRLPNYSAVGLLWRDGASLKIGTNASTAPEAMPDALRPLQTLCFMEGRQEKNAKTHANGLQSIYKYTYMELMIAT